MLSEPGRIAKQVLKQLDGAWGIYLLKDVETLQYLNGMAGGKRYRKSADGIQEEQFDPRTKTSNDWVGLMKRREKRRSLRKSPPSTSLTETSYHLVSHQLARRVRHEIGTALATSIFKYAAQGVWKAILSLRVNWKRRAGTSATE